MLSIADREKDRVLGRRGREESRSSSQIGVKELEGGGREAMKGKDIYVYINLYPFPYLLLIACASYHITTQSPSPPMLLILSHPYCPVERATCPLKVLKLSRADVDDSEVAAFMEVRACVGIHFIF